MQIIVKQRKGKVFSVLRVNQVGSAIGAVYFFAYTRPLEPICTFEQLATASVAITGQQLIVTSMLISQNLLTNLMDVFYIKYKEAYITPFYHAFQFFPTLGFNFSLLKYAIAPFCAKNEICVTVRQNYKFFLFVSDCPSSQYHRGCSVTLEFIIQPYSAYYSLMNFSTQKRRKATSRQYCFCQRDCLILLF